MARLEAACMLLFACGPDSRFRRAAGRTAEADHRHRPIAGRRSLARWESRSAHARRTTIRLHAGLYQADETGTEC